MWDGRIEGVWGGRVKGCDVGGLRNVVLWGGTVKRYRRGVVSDLTKTEEV